ncbi:MAG: bifunctional enoyl-CoA hydratase/phosphate acetyltransferase [Anaerolineae bacterium]
MDYIENRTFDEIQIGESASLTRVLAKKDIQVFAIMSGDISPIHVDEEYAKSDMFHKIIAHGMWGGALISTLLGTKLPGPGAIYLGQTLRFKKPVSPGDTITVTATVIAKNPEKHRITFDCQCVNQNGEVVINGEAEILAPLSKIKRPRIIMPEIHLQDPGAHFRQLIKLTEGLEPMRMAVVHPVDRYSLLGAVDAAQAKLIIPIFVGPELKIRAIAQAEGLDLSPYQLIPTEHSHAAAAQAVMMARTGQVEGLLKGSLTLEELMQAVVAKDGGLRTARRISHVAMMDVATYPRPLFITDANINIYPGLEAKRDIVQNAIDLALTLGIEPPKVAILSAIERISPRLDSTMEAAALCKMAERGQINGGLVDGPLAFDDAVSKEAAEAKGLHSPVAGQADILVVPDLETGTLLLKQLEYMAEGQSADIILGGRVPIALTDQADKPLSRLASCALALLLVQQKRKAKTNGKLTPQGSH